MLRIPNRQNLLSELYRTCLLYTSILNKREYKFAINVIENYLRVCLTGKLRPLFASDFLLVLTEVYPYIKEKEIWDDIGYRLCHDIKESIEDVYKRQVLWSGRSADRT